LTTATVRKPKGRPAGPGTADIRQEIQDAAEHLFARKGYAATSLREIADKVGVNPAMVHYYFGSKLSLLHQVLEQTLEPLALAIAKMREDSHKPAVGFTGLLLRTFKEHPDLPALVAREVMLPGGVMQEHFLKFLAPRLGGSLPGMIQKEQREGRMRNDLDPSITALSVLSLCIFPFIARELADKALNIHFDPAGMQKLEKHIGNLVEKGLAA
jgi:TetR/AcrR family transcriptional regulator